MAKRLRAIEAAVDVVPKVVGAVATENSCILATRVGIEALREFGVHAKPVAVKLIVANRALWELAEGDLSRLVQMRSDNDEYRESGAYAVGVGWAYEGADTTNRYVGHLVMTTTNPDVLVDLTANQASRPQHDMPVRADALPMPRGAINDDLAIFENKETGVRLIYAGTRDMSYRAAPDWCEPTRREPLVEAAVELIRRRLR